MSAYVLTSSGGTRTVSPALVLAAALLAFAIFWLAILDVSSLVPPVDNIEQLVWMHSLQWGYPKHPPLPTFLLWCASGVLGASKWTTYVLGAAMTLSAFAILWRLLRELRGTAYANVAILAALCVTFYNGRMNYFNHNVVLLPLVAASALLCWRAFDRRQLRWWIALGLVVGLGALTKYQIALTVAAIGCFWCSQRAWRDPVHRTGALAAALVALLVVTPHIQWLRDNGFGPITYGVELSAGDLPAGARAIAALNWLADELLNRAAPAFLLLALAWWFSRHRGGQAQRRTETVPSSRALLLCWGIVPMASVPLVVLVFGAQPQNEWGTPFLLFAIPCAMELFPRISWRALSMRATLRVFAGLQVLLVAHTLLTSPIGVRAFMDSHWRTFPAQELKEQLAARARAQLGGRISVVAGPLGEAGALALELPERPAVLVNGSYEASPGVSESLVAACGALELSFLQLDGTQPVGPRFPGLFWRTRLPSPAAGVCDAQKATGQDVVASIK